MGPMRRNKLSEKDIDDCFYWLDRSKNDIVEQVMGWILVIVTDLKALQEICISLDK